LPFTDLRIEKYKYTGNRGVAAREKKPRDVNTEINTRLSLFYAFARCYLASKLTPRGQRLALALAFGFGSRDSLFSFQQTNISGNLAEIRAVYPKAAAAEGASGKRREANVI